MPAFDKRVKDFEAANTQVLGISTDSPFSHENWAKSVGISNYPPLSDGQREGGPAGGGRGGAGKFSVFWPTRRPPPPSIRTGHARGGSWSRRPASMRAP